MSRRYRVRLQFEPRDCWLGVYWRTERLIPSDTYGRTRMRTFWICILPCLPIVIQVRIR